MFSSRTNFNKLFLFHIIKLIKKAVTLRNSLCYSFYFFVQHLLNLNLTGYMEKTIKYWIQIQHLLKLNNKDKNGKTLEIKFKYNTC